MSSPSAPRPPASPPLPPPPLLPYWYRRIALGVLSFIVVLELIYFFGASGFQYRGASFSFGREHEYQLYEIDDHRAFSVRQGRVEIVEYRHDAAFLGLCGLCARGKSIFYRAEFRRGDWVWSRYPDFEGADVYNLRTKKLVELDVPKPTRGVVAAEDVPYYVDHDFTFDDDDALTPEKVAAEFKPISTAREMCVILNAAFTLVLVPMGILGAVLLAGGIRARRRATANITQKS
jgi:hypothetical protein